MTYFSDIIINYLDRSEMLTSSAVSTDLETDRRIPVEVVEETSEWRLPACGLPETEAELCVPQTTCDQRHKQTVTLICKCARSESRTFYWNHACFLQNKPDLLTSATIFSLLKHCAPRHLSDLKATVQKSHCIYILKQLIDFILQESKTARHVLLTKHLYCQLLGLL